MRPCYDRGGGFCWQCSRVLGLVWFGLGGVRGLCWLQNAQAGGPYTPRGRGGRRTRAYPPKIFPKLETRPSGSLKQKGKSQRNH